MDPNALRFKEIIENTRWSGKGPGIAADDNECLGMALAVYLPTGDGRLVDVIVAALVHVNLYALADIIEACRSHSPADVAALAARVNELGIRRA